MPTLSLVDDLINRALMVYRPALCCQPVNSLQVSFFLSFFFFFFFSPRPRGKVCNACHSCGRTLYFSFVCELTEGRSRLLH